MALSTDELTQKLAEIAARGDFVVPPYPAVALKLQRVLGRPNHGLAEVTEVISADPALAARVLSVANSALYRGNHEITTLARAANRLGSRTLSSLAVAAGVGTSATMPGVLFDVKYRVWRRSLSSALVCQKLAPLRGLEADDAFLFGLLHGFGRSLAVAALEALLVKERPVRPLAAEEWLAIAEQQRQRLALVVAERWNLPSSVTAALRDDTAREPAGQLLAQASHIANLLESGQVPAGATPAEAKALDELVKGLPAALDALAAVPAATSGASSFVAKPERALDGEVRRRPLVVTDRRKRAAATLRCTGVTPDGLELESSLPFQEGSMVRLAVGSADDVFEPWLNVVLCSPKGKAFRVEAQLFSPTKDVKERWRALWDCGT